MTRLATPRAVAVALATTVAVVALGACDRGRSDPAPTSTTEPPRLTVEQFATRADRICLAASSRSAEIRPELDPALVPSALEPAARDELADAVGADLDLSRAAYNGLRALRGPEELEPTFDAYLADVREQLVHSDAVIDALRAGDDEAFVAARAAVTAASTAAAGRAVELGFVECSRA